VLWYLVLAIWLGRTPWFAWRSRAGHNAIHWARLCLLLLSYLVCWLDPTVPFNRLNHQRGICFNPPGEHDHRDPQWDEFKREWRTREAIPAYRNTLPGILHLDLLIRPRNPDLWHPWKGWREADDFSYFNAVLKSTTFPPYDPGTRGYLNYTTMALSFRVLVKW